jgi:excisionase family DNA binding protein
MSSKIEEERRHHSERRRGLSVQQGSQRSGKGRPVGEKRRAAEASGEDDLTRLIRMIARQAAREAFEVFREAFDAPAVEDPAPSNLEHAQKGHAGKEFAPPEPGEQFLSVAEVAKRLGVAEKTVRRRIAIGDLPAHRVGKFIRVSERILTAFLTRARPRRG